MKILVLENPADHGYDIYPLMGALLKLRGFESGLARNLIEADSMLNSQEFNLLIVHHSRFEEVDCLKRRHSKIPTAIYSAELIIEGPPGTIPAVFRDRVKKHYDFILEDMGHSVLEVIKNLEEKTKK